MENGHCASINCLIGAGAKINCQMKKTGWSPLHVAAKNNNADIVKLLLDMGADRELQGSHRDFGNNRKPLDVATNEKVKDILMNHKASVCPVGVPNAAMDLQTKTMNISSSMELGELNSNCVSSILMFKLLFQ